MICVLFKLFYYLNLNTEFYFFPGRIKDLNTQMTAQSDKFGTISHVSLRTMLRKSLELLTVDKNASIVENSR